MLVTPINNVNYAYSSKPKMKLNKVSNSPKQVTFGNAGHLQTIVTDRIILNLSRKLQQEIVDIAGSAKPLQISEKLLKRLEKVGLDIKKSVQIDVEGKPYFAEFGAPGKPKTIIGASFDSVCKHEYLSNGETSISLYRENGTLSYKYNYDKSGKLTTKVWENQGNTITSEFQYDQKTGALTKEIWTGDGSIRQRMMEYDANTGKIVRETQYSADGETPLSIKTYDPVTGNIVENKVAADSREGFVKI